MAGFLCLTWAHLIARFVGTTCFSVNGEKQDGGFDDVEGEVFPCAGSYRSGVTIRLLKVSVNLVALEELRVTPEYCSQSVPTVAHTARQHETSTYATFSQAKCFLRAVPSLGSTMGSTMCSTPWHSGEHSPPGCCGDRKHERV